MKIGVPKEIKTHEYRVGLKPEFVRELVNKGHEVLVQTQAGAGVNASDKDYEAAGAKIAPDAKSVFDAAEMIVKVKEPQPVETAMLRENQLLFTYLHLAPDPQQAEGLVKSGCVAIAYETITSPTGGLPALAPMSEVAGRMGPIVGANALFKHAGGLGVLATGVPGVMEGEVLVLGGGVSGYNAARVAAGMGAHVTILERNPNRIRWLDDTFGGRVRVMFSSDAAVDTLLPQADMVIGAVLIPGAAAPRLIKKHHLSAMKKGSVLVDIAIDQGGCAETSRPTTHTDPTYVVDGVVHYCVANMPGAVPVTSTQALNAAVMPYAMALANKGWKKALADDPHLAMGLNVANGHITNAPVAEALGLDYHPVSFT